MTIGTRKSRLKKKNQGEKSRGTVPLTCRITVTPSTSFGFAKENVSSYKIH
jgi:hypothetical protein